MTQKPKRRWFRFRLSTVLILTAILAWAMACRPYRTTLWRQIVLPNGVPEPVGWNYSNSGPPGTTEYHIPELGLNPKLRWPALALLVFAEWKVAMTVAAVRERRRARSATQP
jgi:hypothetical protein